MQPLVSIIIPTYNRAHLIGETLDSVMAQTYQNWECIVVDDGSTDATDELIWLYCTKDDRIQYHHRPKNGRKGANVCRNHGFEISKGEYILFFDSDDILEQNILKLAIESYPSDMKIDFVFYNYCVFEDQNIFIKQNNKSKNPLMDYFVGKINLATSAVLWKRNIISAVSFSEDLKKTQEFDFVLNVFKKWKNRPVIGFYINKTGYFLRKHEKSIVASFKELDPQFLLSDIIVRNKFLKYFSKLKYPEIHIYNRQEMEKSLNFYLLEGSLFDSIRVVGRLKESNKSLTFLKFKLSFYKLIQILFGRDYRFKKSIKELFAQEFYFNFK